MIRPSRRALPVTLLAVSALAATGCGVDTSADIVRDDQQAVSAREVREKQDAAAVASRRAALPTRDGDELAVSVRRAGTIVDNAVRSMRRTGSATTYRVTVNQPDEGFSDLCAGRTDLLQSARRITGAELAQCEANGLQVEQPMIVGYATSVLVTQNGQDIGGDCLTLGGVRSLLARGSRVSNWQQIGFGNHPFSVGALPTVDTVNLVLGTVALGRPVGTTVRADFRDDLETYSTENRLSRFVTNEDRLEALDAAQSAYEERLADQRRSASSTAVRRAEDAAARKVVAQIEVENRRRRAAKITVADPEALEARNLRRVNAAKRTARREAQRTVRASIRRAGTTYRQERLAAALAPGRLAVVSYPFYESHSDVLRPLEIDPRRRASGTGRPDCRFPSQQTIVNGTYPLTLPVYLYGDLRTMRGAAARGLLTRLLDRNASLARERNLAGLSANTITRYRRTFNLPAPSATSTDTGSAPVATPSAPAAPSGGIPGINSPSAP
jgi:ABC-type phosphate transport system substrate-binding protein